MRASIYEDVVKEVFGPGQYLATKFHLLRHFSTNAHSYIFYQSEYWRKFNDELGAFTWAFKNTKHSDRTTEF